MTTLAEIEAATDQLSPDEQRELFLFLTLRLRSAGQPLPEPREFSRSEVAGWIAEDEADVSSAGHDD
ncbi:MAG: hypothetical protein AAF916_12620 [Planctomycetota bacterium]